MLLYIHIPFCASKCGYCAFNSVVDSQEMYLAYVEALCADISASLQSHKVAPGGITSVFIGGGTPNILPAGYYERIFESFLAYVSGDCEISIESNVNLITQHWCAHLRSLGANRISVGVQSFLPQKLAFLEREHSVGDIFSAFSSIQKAGFSNISCDVIYDTPLDSVRSLESEYANLAKLPLSHISAYSLSIDEGSRFGAKQLKAPTQNLSHKVREILESLGFGQYEVSNYAKNGAYCRHNLGYWEAREYIGCGAGAFGRVGSVRTKALSNPRSYIANPHHRTQEVLSAEDLRLEAIMLGLRCKSGVRYDLVRSAANLALLLDSHKLTKTTHADSQGAWGEYIIARDVFLADELAMWLC